MKEEFPAPQMPLDDEPTGKGDGKSRTKKIAEALDDLALDELNVPDDNVEVMSTTPIESTPPETGQDEHVPVISNQPGATTLGDIFPGLTEQLKQAAPTQTVAETIPKKEKVVFTDAHAQELSAFLNDQEERSQPKATSKAVVPTPPRTMRREQSIDGVVPRSTAPPNKKAFQNRMATNGENSPYDRMTYRNLAKDPVAGPVLERVVLEYLKREDGGWTGDEFTGELTVDGYLIRKDGAKPNLKPHQCLGSIRDKDSLQTLDTVLERTREQLRATESDSSETQEVPEGNSEEPVDVEVSSISVGSESEEVPAQSHVPTPVDSIPGEVGSPDSGESPEHEAPHALAEEETEALVAEEDAVPGEAVPTVRTPEEQLVPNDVPLIGPIPPLEEKAQDASKEIVVQTSLEKPVLSEAKEMVPAWRQAREQYIAYRRQLAKTKSEWEDAIAEYEHVRSGKGMMRFLLDRNALAERVQKAETAYDTLLNRFRNERESLVEGFTSGQDDGGAGRERIAKYTSLREAILNRHIDQEVALVERMRVFGGKELSNRLWIATKQFGSWYSKQSLAKKAGIGVAVAVPIAATAALVTGATSMAILGTSAAVAARRVAGTFSGGTVGVALAGTIKGSINKMADSYQEEKLAVSKENFAKQELSATRKQRIATRRNARIIKHVGTGAAVGAAASTAYLVGSSVAEAAHDVIGDTEAAITRVHEVRVATHTPVPEGVSETTNPVEVGETTPALYTVQSGDNVWNIIKEQLSNDEHFTALSGQQQTEAIDVLKDKVIADPTSFGVSGDPNLIRPGDTLNLSKLFSEQPTPEAVVAPETSDTNAFLREILHNMGGDETRGFVHSPVPDDVPPHVENINTPPHEPTPVHESLTGAESVAQSEKSINGWTETVTPKSAFGIEHSPAVSAPEDTSTPVTEQHPTTGVNESVSETSADVRLGDFPQAQADFDRVRSAFSATQGFETRPYIERLFTQENIFSRVLAGKYNMIRGNWGVISNVQVRDVFDGDQTIRLSAPHEPMLSMGGDTENLIRSMLVQTEHGLSNRVPNVEELLEQARKEYWTVGKFYEALGKQLDGGVSEAYPEPVATLASLDTSPEVAQIEGGNDVPASNTEPPPPHEPIVRPRRTEPLLHVEGQAGVENENVVAGGRVGIRIGGNKPIHYEHVRTTDPIAPEAEGFANRLLRTHPDWAEKTTEQLLKEDPEFYKVWKTHELSLRSNASSAPLYRTEIDPRDMETLQHMKGSEALKQIYDEERDNMRRVHYPTKHIRIHPFKD